MAIHLNPKLLEVMVEVLVQEVTPFLGSHRTKGFYW
jgi:hypothetical protein